MENKRVEHLIDEYLLNEAEMDEGKKLDALLDISKIIERIIENEQA